MQHQSEDKTHERRSPPFQTRPHYLKIRPNFWCSPDGVGPDPANTMEHVRGWGGSSERGQLVRTYLGPQLERVGAVINEIAWAHESSTFLRSEPMLLLQMIVQSDAAKEMMEELGETGAVMFVDLTPDMLPFKRKFAPWFKQHVATEQLLSFLSAQVTVLPTDNEASPPANTVGAAALPSKVELVEVIDGLKQLNRTLGNYRAVCAGVVEHLRVLQKFDEIIAGNTPSAVSPSVSPSVSRASSPDPERGANGPPPPPADGPQTARIRGQMLGYVAGVIEQPRLATFERAVFRASRGNSYLLHLDVNERELAAGAKPATVVLVFYQGELLREKMLKMCDVFNVRVVNVPRQVRARQKKIMDLTVQMHDLELTIKYTTARRADQLRNLSRRLPAWQAAFERQKAIYHALNMCSHDMAKCVIAQAWCPTSRHDDVCAALKRATLRAGAMMPTIVNIVETAEMPPTHFSLNKFTVGFQGIINGYGVPRYGEINPAAFTIITFPFLFGVMFGDVGHGLLVLLFAAYLIYNEAAYSRMSDEEMGELMGYPFAGRYIILLMGLFAVYCGFIYNDIFGLNADLWGTAYLPGRSTDALHPPDWPSGVYAFGLDPAWEHTSDELSFTNSYKMKLSILLGVLQVIACPHTSSHELTRAHTSSYDLTRSHTISFNQSIHLQ